MFKVNNKDAKTRLLSNEVYLLLTLNIFHTFFYCFYCRIGTGKGLLSHLKTIYDEALFSKTVTCYNK